MPRWYGSINNRIAEMATKGQPEPKVGMGATRLAYTDRYANTIIEVFKIGKDVAVKVQRDNVKRTDNNGLSEIQTYEYSPNPEGAIDTYRFDGKRWVRVCFNSETKRWKKVEGPGLLIGEREEYNDPSF